MPRSRFTNELLRDINAAPNVDFANFGELDFGFATFPGGIEAPFLFQGETFAFAAAQPTDVTPFPNQEQPVGILNAILDVARPILGPILGPALPDPLERVLDIFFPRLPTPVFSGIPASATPPFFPSPLEPDPVDVDPFEGLFTTGQEVFAPGGFFEEEQPGIFDDLARGVIDIVPDLIPDIPVGPFDIPVRPIFDLIGEFFGDEDVQMDIGQLPDEDVFEDPFLNPPFEADELEEPMANGICPPRQQLPQCLTPAQWAQLGNPEGYRTDKSGLLIKRRHRRRRPLSQQAKDDLGWAKATFGQGKAFDNVVARMRL